MCALALTVFWSVVMWGSVASRIYWSAVLLEFPWVLANLFVLGWSMVGSAVPTPVGLPALSRRHGSGPGAVRWLTRPPQWPSLCILWTSPAALVGLFYFLRGEVNLERLRALISVKAVEHAVEDEKVVMAESS
jgi:hypothetical protein